MREVALLFRFERSLASAKKENRKPDKMAVSPTACRVDPASSLVERALNLFFMVSQQ